MKIDGQPQLIAYNNKSPFALATALLEGKIIDARVATLQLFEKEVRRTNGRTLNYGYGQESFSNRLMCVQLSKITQYDFVENRASLRAETRNLNDSAALGTKYKQRRRQNRNPEFFQVRRMPESYRIPIRIQESLLYQPSMHQPRNFRSLLRTRIRSCLPGRMYPSYRQMSKGS